ncbi:hypothetical protein CYY_006300 [Polysphondylium violaceum]|uniref:Transmembrane protein n=1 Tax=Polysphondylium violaceum TaxID=133409 RepID=A0A8J4PS39_9MYCE|nr:hypothetical protein CYY_006300 [Polysphondylium violaceum]
MNKVEEIIEPFDDLSGVGAPFKRESEVDYFARRAREQEETRQVFLKEGIKGGIYVCAATAGFILAGSLISHKFRKTISYNIRTFIISSGFIAGFWVWGETASLKFIKSRLHNQMVRHYNEPETQSP